MLFRPSVLLVTALTTLLLGACSNRLNTQTVADTITAEIERQGRRLTLQTVRCPTEIDRQAGAYFRCVGELTDGRTFTINVTQLDSQGQVEWDVPNSTALLNLGRVETEIQDGLAKALGQRALIDCGSELYRINAPGDQFECQVVGRLTDGADSIDTVLVKIDPDGNLNWQEIRTGPISTAQVPISPSAAPVAGSAQGTSPGASAPSQTPAVTTTPTTGPTGRPIQRPYIPGDSD